MEQKQLQMCGRVFAFLLFLPVPILGASTKPIPEQMKYIGISYDIIKGNPEGSAKNGGVDPGLMTTRRVLKLTYDDKKLTNDNEYRVPDEVSFMRRSSAYTSKEKDVFYGTKSYAKKLSHQVSLEVGVDAVFASFKFGASHEYKSVDNEEKTNGYVYFSEQTIENFGEIRYRMSLVQDDAYELSREFCLAVCRLPASYRGNEAEYMGFLTNWGTHVVVQATLGARRGTTYREDKSSFIRNSAREMANSLNVEGSYKIVSGSFSLNMDRATENAESQEKFGSMQKTYSVGSEEYNEPISIKLIRLTEVLDAKFWTRQTSYTECANWQREAIQANILEAFGDYPQHNGVTASEDIPMSMRLTWPSGKYALPQAAVLDQFCPQTNDFTWEDGLLYQVSKGPNECSSNNHLTNYCNRQAISNPNGKDMRTYYCVKSIAEATPNSPWDWMPGVYCIFKVGNECPSGFQEGTIRWNDKQRGKDPDYNALPAGEYSPGRPTEIKYCCREDGTPRTPIILPTDSSFYLIRFHSACQEVVDMTVTAEYLEWATETADPELWQEGQYPRPGNTGQNVKINYCFYQPKATAKREFGNMAGAEDEGHMRKDLQEVRELVDQLEHQLDYGRRAEVGNEDGGRMEQDEDKEKKSQEVGELRELELLQQQSKREEEEERELLMGLLLKELAELK
ncbi:uncharacterized protein LOC121427751 isoform X1 [Lytechinus variegatus]|uniref:uncharacterized protein LOC121427751 isoform X1 n=2 Tax=Lytechinus variegatus TaxID=7654 RepID=UPI001BB27087|nr:uncharacterized protein LOC121427751 isoform X1 [Lytechinus variegatus]